MLPLVNERFSVLSLGEPWSDARLTMTIDDVTLFAS